MNHEPSSPRGHRFSCDPSRIPKSPCPLFYLHSTFRGGWFFPTSYGHITRNDATTFEATTIAKEYLPLKTKIKCRNETSCKFCYLLSNPTAALSVRCSDWCLSMWRDQRTRRKRTSAAGLWKQSRNVARRFVPANATATILCAVPAIAAGIRGCNCLAASSASLPRHSTTAAFHTNAHYNYKSNFINSYGEERTIQYHSINDCQIVRVTKGSSLFANV